MFAESVQFDGTAIATFIAIAVLVVVVGVGAVVLGFVLAPRAARGSQTAMGWWVVTLAIEALPTVGSLGALRSGGFNWRVPIMPAIVAAQIGLFGPSATPADRPPGRPIPPAPRAPDWR